MKILEHTYINPSISIYINKILLDNTGIYLLEGENGSGKTSVIENILRNKKIEISGAYKDNVSYFCQEDKRYDISVEAYLACDNIERKNEIANKLGIDYFQKNVTEISGGEYTKIKFARTILKTAKILIFDEPTNNLDDEATEEVVKILDSISQHSLIIIISHDPRLDLQVTKKLRIENNSLNIYVCDDSKDYRPSDKFVQSKLIYNMSYFKRTFFSKMNLITTIFLVLLAIVLGNVSNSILSPRIASSPIIGRNDYLELLNIGSVCGDGYDDSYLTAGNTCVNDQFFNLEDVKNLSMLPYIKRVYVFDSSYEYQDLNSGKINYDAFPSIILESPYQKRAFACSDGFLVVGRLPYDYKKEFVTSVNILKNNFGIHENINSLMGREVEVNAENMKLVGVIQNDVVCLSYHNQVESSIVEYNEEEHDRLIYIENQLLVNAQQQGFDRVYIEYDEADHEKLIEYIADNGASYQVTSDLFKKQIQLRQYNNLRVPLLLSAVGISIVFAVILNILTKKSYVFKKNELSDLSNLTFEYRKESIVFHQIMLIDMGVSFLIAFVIICLIISNKVIFTMTIPFIFISFIIMYATIIILRFVESRK